MSSFIHTDADLAAGMAALVALDPRRAPMLEKAGMPAIRRRPAGFEGLCRIVCGQQLSTASAAAIWARVADAFDPFHHDALRRSRAARLARLGLSRPKIKTLKDYTETDRIAVPSVKISMQAILLEMAVAKEFGEVNVKRVKDSLEVLFTVLMEPSGSGAEGWQTGIALDASG